MAMRRIAAQLEALEGLRFVLVIALVAGAIRSIPQLLLSGPVSPLELIPFLVIGLSGVLWWIAALLLWWVAIRRHQSSLLLVATQVTLGLIIADLFAGALAMVAASIETRGEAATVLAQQLSSVVLSNLTVALVRSPLWLVGSALAVALGRHLDGGQPRLRGPTSTADPGAIV
jgi:hypothetical protein